MVKELGIIRSGSGGIIGCKSAADQVYYFNLTIEILKYFSAFQVDNKIVITYEDVEHIDRVELSRFNYGPDLYLDIYYDLFIHARLMILDDEIPNSLKYDWNVRIERNLCETIFIFN